MTSSTTRAFMAKKPFATASAFMAKTNQLLSTMASLRLLLVMFVALSVTTNAWADYTITFKTNGDTDGSNAQTSIANLISSGGEYVSTISADKAYNGKNEFGVKLGSSKSVGYVTMTLTNSGKNIGQIKASKLIVNAAYFKQGPTLKVTVTYSDNSTLVKSLSLTDKIAAYDVTLSSTKTLKSIKIESVKGSSEYRAYCHSIKVVAAAAVTTYTVTYDLNGGTGTTPTQADVAAGGTFTLAASSGFSKAEYSFAGWNDGTTTYNAGATYTMPAKAVTLKAQWTALPKYTVTWEVNGDQSVTTQVTEGSKPTFPATPSSCDATSTTFYGWATATWDGKIDDINGKTIYTSANEMPEVNGAVTYYAVFAKKETSGSGTAGWNTVTSPADLEVGATYAISNEATNGTYLSTWDGGNNFDGSTSTICPLILGGSEGAWTFQIADGGTYNNYYLTATGQSNNRLKAVSILDEQCQFSISFDNNISNITCTTKDTHNILRYNPNGGSPIFACYSSGQSDVYLQKYSTGSTATYSDYITSCTKETSYFVTWNPNGGNWSGNTNNKVDSYEEGESISKPADPTRDGYTFNSWDPEPANKMGTENLTYTAQWSAKTITITWNQNYTDCPVATTSTYIYDGEEIAMPAEPIRTGYKFNGWFTATTDGTKITEVGTTNKPTEDVTYYAQWTANTYIVTLDDQEATTAGAASVTATYDAAMPSIASKLPQKTGYTFNGYFDAASGGTQYYKADGTSAKNWDKTAATTLYAQWTLIEYTLSLESTLKCVDNGSITIAYNATSAKTFSAATRDDYTCTGYWSAPSGGVQVLNADGSFAGNDVNDFITDGKWINTTATKLTPRWETEYKMILSKGTEENGTYTLSTTNIETSECATSTTRQVTITATPNTGYEVDQITYSGAGTATKKSGPTLGAGKTTWVYTFAENDKGTGTFTVTFKSLPKYTVSFSTGTGNPTQADIAETTANAGITLPIGPTPTCTDWKFAGWWTESVAGTTTSPGKLLTAGSNYKPTSDCTLFAVYSYTEAGGGGSGFYLSVTQDATTYYIGEKGSGAFLSAVTDVNSAATFNIESNQYLYYGNKTYVSSTENSTSLTIATTTPTVTWAITDEGETITFKSNGTRGRYLAFNYNNGSPRFSSYGSTYTYELTKHTTSTTTYNSNPTCLVPVWNGATIDKNSFTVNCGGRSPMTGANAAAIISFPTEDIYNFTKDITIEATTGFLVSTSQNVDANYKSSVSLSPLVGTANANTFYDKHVYVRAEAPAMSEEDLSGTITIKNNKDEILQTFSVTADVTCTTYTLTLDDRGTKTTTEYYAGASVPKPAAPEGVCTDPINYVFDGWSLDPVTDENTTSYEKVTFPFDMPAVKTTLYAVYRWSEAGGGDGDYHLVEKALDDWSGDYLIAYSNNIFADGRIGGTGGGAIGAKDVRANLSEISENTILADDGDTYKVTLEAVIGGYVLKTQDDLYNYQSSNASGLASTDAKNTAGKYPIVVDFVSSKDVKLCITNAQTGNLVGPVFHYNPEGYFRFYKDGGQQPVYLYKKADGVNYFTTSPVCGPHLEITAGDEIYVTGGKATHSLVIAQQKVEFTATRLKTSNGQANGTAPDVKVATNGITVGGQVTNDVTVEIEQNKEQQSDGTYTIVGSITVKYQPNASNKQEDIQVQLAVDYNSDAKDAFTVHARSLPEEFVIVAKQGDKWYALNADMSGSDAEKANGYLRVDDIEDPTKATFAPCNTIYTFDGMVDGGNKEYMRFQGIDGKYLWAASAGNTGIQNYAKNTPAAGTIAYNWQLYTNDNETYQLENEGNGRKLGLSKDLNYGMYSYVSTLQQDIRILPYVEKCIYNNAPTNLKVSVLKSTYVTLTWDAVAGATKYQYSTNGTTWTDAGTEPTVTINGLEDNTKYTYYIRAYHEDAGVSQECIDYAEITFTTADCDDVPTDITYTADLNSITVSWTAAAPTATIKLFMDEEGTHLAGSYPGAKSPKKISGGLKKNTTYYIQILSNGTCASPIIPVKTEDVEVDIVEWMPDGIIVDINTDETVGVTLENEVSYGSGAGAEATELFFSKYYKATGNVKLVAIYNGTKNIIDLTDYEIHYGKDSWESQHITLKDFGETKGQIQPGEELILYTTNESNDDNKILDCVNKQYPDGKWVRVTQANNAGGGYLSFAGNKTLVLKKASTIIDVIGALNSDRSKPTSTNANEWPSWGDAAGWNCATGLSIADDTQIGISTNRCLLIRNNTVTSGENAVTSNIDDFVTLCSEWKGAQVPDNNVDNGVAASCENFAYVGTFDYSDYYTQYESMGDEKEFDENARNADGTVTIPITDLYKQSCRNIRVKLSDKDGNVLTDREYKVPIMITTTQGTDGQAFLNLQENLATVEVDGNGDPTGNKTNLTLAQAKEICKTCDVVVRDNAILTKADDDAADDHPEVRDVYIYENSSLIVPNGTNYTINSLSLRRKEDAVASVSTHPDALKLPESAAAPISLDFRLSAKSWHWFTLPYDCNISEVTWVDGSPAQYNVDWFLMTYDGEKRAATQAGGCWKAHTGTTIKAGEGFILAINGNINNPAHTYELRFPMSKEVLAAEGTDKTVDVRAWGVETNIRPNHKGWNLVGNPYLAYYQRNNITNFEGLRLGQLTGPDPQTGYWEQTGEVPYIVVPVGAGWVAYEQVLASDIDLLPFTAYFVQVGNDGTHNSTQDLKVAFDHTKLQLSATPMPASIIQRSATEDEEPIIVGVSLTNAKGESDKTSLIIDDQYTDEYEMHADFFKWFGDYYTYYTKPVLYTVGADQGKRAFNALNEELATQPVALGMYAAQAGEYTFTLDLRSDLSHVEEIWLHDATENIYTNLLQDSYTFSTGKINGEGRFFLSVKMKPQQEPDPDPEPTPDPTPDSDPETSLDDIVANRVFATVKDNVIYISGLLSDAQLWIYDAAGRLMHYDQTKYYQHTYLVPQGGAYFVRVQGTMQTQTIKVVVK